MCVLRNHHYKLIRSHYLKSYTHKSYTCTISILPLLVQYNMTLAKKVISVDFFKLRIKGLSHYMCIYIPISIYLLHWVPAALLKEHQGREGSDLPFWGQFCVLDPTKQNGSVPLKSLGGGHKLWIQKSALLTIWKKKLVTNPMWYKYS